MIETLKNINLNIRASNAHVSIIYAFLLTGKGFSFVFLYHFTITKFQIILGRGMYNGGWFDLIGVPRERKTPRRG
jgi:hypothetical protein